MTKHEIARLGEHLLLAERNPSRLYELELVGQIEESRRSTTGLRRFTPMAKVTIAPEVFDRMIEDLREQAPEPIRFSALLASLASTWDDEDLNEEPIKAALAQNLDQTEGAIVGEPEVDWDLLEQISQHGQLGLQ